MRTEWRGRRSRVFTGEHQGGRHRRGITQFATSSIGGIAPIRWSFTDAMSPALNTHTVYLHTPRLHLRPMTEADKEKTA